MMAHFELQRPRTKQPRKLISLTIYVTGRPYGPAYKSADESDHLLALPIEGPSETLSV